MAEVSRAWCREFYRLKNKIFFNVKEAKSNSYQIKETKIEFKQPNNEVTESKNETSNNEINELKKEIEKLKYENKKLRDELTIEKNNNKKLNEELNNKNDKIEKLNEELKNKNNQSCTQLNNKVNELQTNLNNMIIEIEKLKKEKTELINQINNLKNPDEKIICAQFKSVDQNIDLAIPCKDTDIFVQLEEKLYELYPEYKETNNFFTCNGLNINRFKSLKDNKIKNSDKILLNNI